MKRTFQLLTATAAAFTLSNLAGCITLERGSYHVERGDLVSNDGAIRYVGWCDPRPHTAQCVKAKSNGIVAASR
jgi:hypothetical protein